MKAILVIIYNHHFPANVEVLNKLYGGRFLKIFHLMPFGNYENPEIIPVYDSSEYFQGYVAQAIPKFIGLDFDHAIFLGDDVFLNPNIDEQNYAEYLQVDQNQSFIPGLIDLSEMKHYWARAKEALRWRRKTSFIQVEKLLPTFDEGITSFNKYGINFGPIGVRATINSKYLALSLGWALNPIRNAISNLRERLLRCDRKSFIISVIYKLLGGRFPHSLPEFPIVGSYSDIFAVNKDSLEKFGRLCGIFAAQCLHVELAIPTALINSSAQIVTEDELKYSGKAFWGNEIKEIDSIASNIDDLILNFPSNFLYIHPIKLSKWTNNENHRNYDY